MPGPGEDDREAVDRAFADLVAGYHLTSDRPDPLLESGSAERAGQDLTGAEPTGPDRSTEPIAKTTEAPDAGWADSHPLFRFVEQPVADVEPEPDEEFVPEPPMPLPRPAWPVLLAWIAMGYAVLAVLAASMGLKLPAWAGWAALICFVGAFGVLVARLPRHRPPDAGNGAVL